MNCSPGLCASYKNEIVRGVHAQNDRYMLALYTDGKLDEFTTKYVSAGEARGLGYKPGGIELKNFDVSQEGSATILTWDDACWDKATLTNVAAGLIYNASKANRAVGVIKLAELTSSTNGPFVVYFPLATAAEGVFVID